jgi:hypothetical protein
MRKNGLFVVVAAVLAMAALIPACQKAEVTDQEAGWKLKDAYSDCHAQCVSPGSGTFYELTTTQSYTPVVQGSVTVAVFNTEREIVYKITSSDHNIRKVVLNGETPSYASLTPATEPFYIKRPLGTWKSCEVKTATIEVRRENSDGIGSGVYLKFETSYNLVPLCTTTTIKIDKSTPVCTGEDVTIMGKVTAGALDIRGGSLTIQELVGSEWTNVGTPVTVAPGVNTVTYAYTATAATRSFRTFFDGLESNGKESQSEVIAVTTKTCNVNPPASGCTDDFNYKKNEDGTYTFTYKPAADKTGATLVFTFAQGIVMQGLSDWKSNGVTKQKVMDLKACQEYTWSMTLDCKDNPGARNLWTDFTVNEVSKKGTLKNIKCE